MPRPFFNKTKRIAEILRVDHAGEYGAVRIYSGQLDASKTDRIILQEMLSQENEHLAYFAQQISQNNIRPTLLLPIWHIGGYIMGFLTRLASKETAMLCTQAVEEVIERHYQEQLDDLAPLAEKALSEKITIFREDELEHRDAAVEYGSGRASFAEPVAFLIKTICRTAINFSKRL